MFFVSDVVLKSIFLPLLGTTLGSGCVFFLKKSLSMSLKNALLGFASGVMVAASVWSLIMPAIDMSLHLGAFSFVPALLGFWLGVLSMLVLSRVMPEPEIEDVQNQKPKMLIMAVTIHNLPEGMAVGATVSALLSGDPDISAAATVVLALGVAIQNLPEGSIISMPLAASGMGKFKAFLYGFLSGVVEPIGAVLTILLASLVTPILPYMLSFAAGTMVFVTLSELIPQILKDNSGSIGTLMFCVGFTIMMCLDVALG